LVEEGEYTSTELVLGVGDRLILHSDGITECPDGKGALLDEVGFQKMLSDCAGLQGSELTSELLARLRTYRESDDFPDDISAVVVEFR
jgi:sigma-B regulation protein RsbU (phosphoserine phosphatase)